MMERGGARCRNGGAATCINSLVRRPRKQRSVSQPSHSGYEGSRKTAEQKPVRVMGPQGMAPQITKQPESRSAKPGHKVDFKATATGSPAPDITWCKDGRPVSSTIGDIVVSTTPISQEEVTTTLTISNVTVEDAGKYVCVATNCWGRAESIQVTLEVKGGKEPPRFIEQLEPVAATDGSPAILLCTVVGSQPIHIKWFQNRPEVKDTKDFQMHYDLQTGLVSLTIPEIYADDQGLYTCRAFNEYGQDETSAAVTVVGKS
ncbi:palladin-like [Dermacentor albipictus]|uniref:palladin-like n=1 Tax=Dermacentor albipictus TaxID=60249 RepID=UPI0038FBF08D